VKLALGKPSEMLSALAAEEGLPDHGGPGPDEGDPLFRAAIAVVQEYDRASASLLQRRLKIGYAQTARIIDQLEARGYVGSFDGSNARRVLRHEDSASRER
jgi:DNA segregation ATPase FtsK/SpoIIIE-like protein